MTAENRASALPGEVAPDAVALRLEVAGLAERPAAIARLRRTSTHSRAKAGSGLLRAMSAAPASPAA